ncbi:MAG: serine protease [Oscillospiraceae bacterium]|nr:serine protease [Oscillospiraceae bacterium]
MAAIGNPHENTRNAITTGRITSRGPVPFGDEMGKTQHHVITHSAKISAGSSGGALLNKDLKIVGIHLGGSRNVFRFIEGKAMPCDKVLEFLSDME